MIPIPRSLARSCRAVFRKLVRKPISFRPLVCFHAGTDGLRVRLHHADIAAEYHQPGPFHEEVVILPLDALADFEGRKDTVSLESTVSGSVLARWEDAGVPQVKEYDAQDPAKLPQFPDPPEVLADVDAGFLKTLEDASQSASRDATRYAVNHIQLRGATGQVIATDGRQLLIQYGFRLPFTEEVLIPSTPVFGCKELNAEAGVKIGKSATHVCLQAGAWTLHLPIDKDGRFPKAEYVIPSLSGTVTRWHLDPADAVFLAKALPRLPGDGDTDAPITLDLNGQAMVRARAEGQARTTELVLSRSEVSGPPQLFRLNRNLLARGLQLGFADVAVVKGDVPLLFQDERRKFVVMPLGKDGALPPGEDVLRITSAGDEPATQPSKRERRRDPITKQPPVNGQRNGHPPLPPASATPADPAPNGTGLGALIAEAQALKDMLHDAYSRSARLVAALKRQKKQSRLMVSTLASLRQLQQIDT